MKSVELIERNEIPSLVSTMDIFVILNHYMDGRDAEDAADEIKEYIESLAELADTVISTDWLQAKIDSTLNETRRRAFDEVRKEILGE